MNLEEQLAHLQWRKVCNQSQIQGALKQTKQLHERDILRNATEGKDRTKWVRQVVCDEMSKPLEVPMAIIEAMQRETEQENQAIEDATALHSASVATIQAKIRQREEQAKRQRAYRKNKLLLQGSPSSSHHGHSRCPSPST